MVLKVLWIKILFIKLTNSSKHSLLLAKPSIKVHLMYEFRPPEPFLIFYQRTCQIHHFRSKTHVFEGFAPFRWRTWPVADISLKFIMGLPLTSQHHDSSWVIVDRLTKTAHFIPVNTIYRAPKYAEIYLYCIVCLHGVPKMIISGHGTQFVARFWEQLGIPQTTIFLYDPHRNIYIYLLLLIVSVW